MNNKNVNERFISPLLQKDKADTPFVLETPQKNFGRFSTSGSN